jgi:hypothetical protein
MPQFHHLIADLDQGKLWVQNLMNLGHITHYKKRNEWSN